ncbi:unnamed protein product [Cuscuta epithymum]|uniref:Uncharacterized protein n=1 Tax=Cuscuta epithymum TaxID=186058 RepID=A0AAV0DLP1_9ASTE|nr:unnamed protein product [Cuscuta epithymum]
MYLFDLLADLRITSAADYRRLLSVAAVPRFSEDEDPAAALNDEEEADLCCVRFTKVKKWAERSNLILGSEKTKISPQVFCFNILASTLDGHFYSPSFTR